MRILIVKLGALGDVLRTTPLLTALRRRHPKAEIVWIVDARHEDILRGNPLIDRLWSFSDDLLRRLPSEKFDWALNLDKDDEALASITAVAAVKKSGFGRDADGRVCALDADSEYAWRLGVDDELKFRKNQKTYQQISFEQAGLRFNGEEYLFDADADSAAFARTHLKALGVPEDALCIGLNTGSGARFAGKRLPVATLAELADRFRTALGAQVLLLGGEDEIERNRELAKRVSGTVNTGSHSIRRFAAMVKRCDLIVSGDTTAMHIAIAVKTPVVVYFASTCAAEIELYGRGDKIVSGIDCAPCYKRVCPIDEQCMKEMRVEDIFEAVRRRLTARTGVSA